MTQEPYRVTLSKRAIVDLERIHRYIAGHSEQNAAGVIDQILNAIEGLEIFPHRTLVEHQHPGLRHPVRSLAVTSSSA